MSSASLCRESGLKGALKLARVWRTITTTPGLSDKDARPVTGRTRHTGSGGSQHQVCRNERGDNRS
ncbi:hypothetical protein AH048_22760 [Salmonella enterica subsp. enterica]|uniref:Uncharacterized protein n=2 Tax=Salmonella enterica TaxID=28901 RepID=A0A6Y2KPU5_SALDZ|nr:hypothetical protein [Salmonella enterica subsp. enterica serovar Muenchen]EAC0178261.1 hypothetical protein [Salmonella enterica subsp. enterica serovar Rubislaw]EBG4096456.1 hypothetical protein [Salmonella enterica]ECB3493201.1 hypothetical protein [Salmonella enterica subsp. enterica serovar Newport]ECE7004278.1 hypothetical protein [Salmonella enterica subsp. enterica]ECJ4207766.1 hypothetical protein [Salmonella enterica subsp. enterica serovar Bovismorbificans]EDQ2968382.1 hypotheti